MPTDVDSAAETARFWVTFGQASGLGMPHLHDANTVYLTQMSPTQRNVLAVGVTAAATAIGASFASKALDKVWLVSNCTSTKTAAAPLPAATAARWMMAGMMSGM